MNKSTTAFDFSFSHQASGFSLIELLVTMVVSSMIILGASSLYFDTLTSYHDKRIRSEADELARTILDTIAYDIRNAGSGIPDVQAFQMGTGGIGSLAYPVLSTSTSATIIIQFSESGKYTVNTKDETPSAGAWSMDVIDSSLFAANDLVSISGLSTGIEFGLRGQLSSAEDNTLTFAAGSLYSTGAVFKDGSMVYKVVVQTFNSPVDWSGITINQGLGAAVIAPNTTFLASYLDRDDATVVLSDRKVETTLAKIELTVYARGAATLTDGSVYTAWAKQKVGIPHLILSRQQDWL